MQWLFLLILVRVSAESAPNTTSSSNGTSALFLACQNGHVDVVAALLSSSPDTAHVVNPALNEGASPLFIACQKGHLNVVAVLLWASKNNSEVNQATNFGASPLYIACEKGYVGIVRVLLSSSARVNQVTKTGSSPLYIACEQGHVSVVYALLSAKNIQVNVPLHDDGATPLFVASQNGHVEAVLVLLTRKDIQINSILKDGATPLFIACQNGHVSVVQALLSTSKDLYINQPTNSGATPLYIATELGRLEVVRLLLKTRGIRIDQALHDGRTPLFAAAKSGRTAVVQLLLKHQCDVSLENNQGMTALDVALRQKHMGIGALIYEAGGRRGLPFALRRELFERSVTASMAKKWSGVGEKKKTKSAYTTSVEELLPGIDVILYINLDARVDRRTRIENEFRKIGVEPGSILRISAEYTPDNGAIGCLKSHIQAMRVAIQEYPGKNVLICEDDLVFTQNREELRHTLSSFMLDPLFRDRFDVLMLSHNTQNASQTHRPGIIKMFESQMASAYLSNTHYLQKLLALYEEVLHLFENGNTSWKLYHWNDQCWKMLQKRDNWYGVNPPVAMQGESFSDIERKVVKYNFSAIVNNTNTCL